MFRRVRTCMFGLSVCLSVCLSAQHTRICNTYISEDIFASQGIMCYPCMYVLRTSIGTRYVQCTCMPIGACKTSVISAHHAQDFPSRSRHILTLVSSVHKSSALGSILRTIDRIEMKLSACAILYVVSTACKRPRDEITQLHGNRRCE